MKRIRNNKNLKIIASISVVLFSLVTTFSGAIAWFQAMRNSTTGAASMKVTPTNGQLKNLSIYELPQETGFVNNQEGNLIGYSFNTTATSSIDIDWMAGKPIYDFEAPSLGRYSLLQKTNPILLVFELYELTPANEVTITALADAQYEVSQYESAANPTSNPLSWVSKYSSKVFGNTMSSSDFVISIDSLSGEGSFAQVDSQGTVTSFTRQKTFYHGLDDTLIRYVCIVLDYYEPAMEYFYSVNLGKSFISDFSKDVPFDIDWTMTI